MNNLKAEMARRNLTAEKLAILIDMPVSTFYRKFQGHTEFTISEAFAISNVLKNKIDYLFAKEEQYAETFQ